MIHGYPVHVMMGLSGPYIFLIFLEVEKNQAIYVGRFPWKIPWEHELDINMSRKKTWEHDFSYIAKHIKQTGLP